MVTFDIVTLSTIYELLSLVAVPHHVYADQVLDGQNFIPKAQLAGEPAVNVGHFMITYKTLQLLGYHGGKAQISLLRLYQVKSVTKIRAPSLCCHRSCGPSPYFLYLTCKCEAKIQFGACLRSFLLLCLFRLVC